jgi:hypothetical protein
MRKTKCAYYIVYTTRSENWKSQYGIICCILMYYIMCISQYTLYQLQYTIQKQYSFIPAAVGWYGRNTSCILHCYRQNLGARRYTYTHVDPPPSIRRQICTYKWHFFCILPFTIQRFMDSDDGDNDFISGGHRTTCVLVATFFFKTVYCIDRSYPIDIHSKTHRNIISTDNILFSQQK